MLKAVGITLSVLGALSVAAGGTGLNVKPPRDVVVSAELATPAVAIPPEFVALAAGHSITIEGKGVVVIRTARPVDAEAWIRQSDVSLLRGVKSWDALDAGPTWRYSDDEREPSNDIWRTESASATRVVLDPDSFEPGITVIVSSKNGTDLVSASLDINRDVGFDWALPVLSAGAAALAVGIVMLAIRWLDLRPAQARVEEKSASRRKKKDQGKPGLRRARREAAAIEARPSAPEVDSSELKDIR